MSIILLSLLCQTSIELDLRDQYLWAYEDSKKALEQIDQLENKNRTSIETGYLGAMQMLMADHEWNPFRKLNYFSKGRENLEEAIGQDPQNAELRYLRLINQLESPVILSYKSEIEEDLRILVKSIYELDSDLRKRISSYMETCDKLSLAEKHIFIQ